MLSSDENVVNADCYVCNTCISRTSTSIHTLSALQASQDRRYARNPEHNNASLFKNLILMCCTVVEFFGTIHRRDEITDASTYCC